MPRPTVKIAELAVRNAYVGRVRVPVYNPGHYVPRNMVLPESVTYIYQIGSRCLLEQEHAFFGTQEIEP
jgi:hypothetical protein